MFAGIDIASERHTLARLDEDGAPIGKPPKLALIAAMRKLLHAIYSVAKNRKPFVIQATPARAA